MESDEREGETEKFGGHNNNDEELDAAMALAALVEGRQIRTVKMGSDRNLDAISWSLRRRRSGSLVVVNEQGEKLRENVGLSNLGQENAKGPAETPLVSGVDQAKVEKAFQQGLAGIAQLLQEERPLIRAPSFPPQLSTNTLLPQLSLASQSSFGGGGLSNGGELQPQLSAPSAFLAAIAASLPPTTSQPWSAFPTLANPLSNLISAPPAYPFLERQDGPSSDGPDSSSPKLVNFLPMAKQAPDEAQEMAARSYEELVAVKEESQGLGFGASGKRRPMHSRRKRSAPDETEDPDPVKEAQRLRRIQANRESARKTIMRKQALCKKLSTEAKRLGDENTDLKSKVEATHSELQRLMMEQAKLRDELIAAHSEGGDPLDVHPSTSAPLLPDLSDEHKSNEGLPKPTLLADLENRDADQGAPTIIKTSKGSLMSIPENAESLEDRSKVEKLSEGNRSTPEKSTSLECSVKSGEGSNVKKGESNENMQTSGLLIKTGSNESVSGERPLEATLVRQDTASLLALLDSGTAFEKGAPSSKPGDSFSRALGEGAREPVSKAEVSADISMMSASENEKPTKSQTPPLPLSLSLLQSIASELRSDREQPLLHAQSLPPKPQDSWLSLRPQSLQRHLSAPKELIQRQLAAPDSLQKASSSSVAFEEAGPKQSVDLNCLWRPEKGPGGGDAFAANGNNGRTQSGQGWDIHTWNELTKAGSGVGFWESKDDGLLLRTQPVVQAKPEPGLYSLYSRGGGRRGSVSLHIGPLPVVDAVTAAEARKRRREVTKSKFGASGTSGSKMPKTSNAKAAR